MLTIGASSTIAVACVVFILWRLLLWRRQGVRRLRECLVSALFAWGLVIVYFTFFPMNIIFYDWHGSLSLIPFTSTINLLKYSTGATAFKNIAGNILLFVPVGIFLPLLFGNLRRFWPLIWRVAVISVVIEILQLFTRVRATDTDDVILNVLGAVVGLLVFRGMYAAGRKSASVQRALTRVGSRSGSEPLLKALPLVLVTLVLSIALIVPQVISHTLSTAQALAGVPYTGEGTFQPLARTSLDNRLFVMGRDQPGASAGLRCLSYKRVLPGRYTQTAWGELADVGGSFYTISITEFNPKKGELPVLAVFGRNEAGAAVMTVRVPGDATISSGAVGEYFVFALRLDLTDDFAGLSVEFFGAAGAEVTDEFKLE